MIVKDSMLYRDIIYLKIEKILKRPKVKFRMEVGDSEKCKIYSVSDVMTNSE